MSLWEQTKAAASAAADATARSAKKVSYQARIAEKKYKIQSAKQRMGVGVYEAFDMEDEPFARELFAVAQAKILALEGEIMALEGKIQNVDPKYVPSFVPSSRTPALAGSRSQIRDDVKTVDKSSKANVKPPPPASPRSNPLPSKPPPPAHSLPSSSATVSQAWKKPLPPSTLPPLQSQQSSSSAKPSVHDSGGANFSNALAPVPSRSVSSSPASSSPSALCSPSPSSSASFRSSSPAPRANVGATGGKPLTGMQALLAWAQQCTEGFNQVNVNNFTSAWQNGLAFAALVCAFRPELVNVSKLDPSNPTACCQTAFDASEEAGVSVLIDAEDMAYGDKKSIICQVPYHIKKC